MRDTEYAETPHEPTEPTEGRLLPPWWAFLLMLFFVVAAVAGLVMIVLALGGRAAANVPPRLEILTADPASLSRISVPTPEAASVQSAIISAPTVNFVMAGPTLMPNYTPTPESISIGKTVIVIDVGDQQLNVRDQPGVLGTTVIFRVPESNALLVIDGPQQADGLTWWKIKDPNSAANREGWAASNYLQPVPSEPTE